MEKEKYCLRCLSIGLKKTVYANSEDYLETQNPYEKFLADSFCIDCVHELNIPLERPEYIQNKLTKDLLRLSMNIDNISSFIFSNKTFEFALGNASLLVEYLFILLIGIISLSRMV